ncbi:helix-turn-helix domain-containing protein [Phytohabitans kaempferiae]|uniref:Helix-turn-helix domain-containing protein n=1 Tax=Phytohabitans kaempferiae TaxID=1620943 RepID=A0ABV6MDM1_9ACTN
MESQEWAIGQRIASHRGRCGLTQEELAGLVGISLSMMKKIESGDRLVTRFSLLVLFAQALRIKDLRELTGVPLALMPDGRRGHPSANAVYAALMDRGRSVAEPVDLADLTRCIEHAWRTWQAPSAFRYDAVGQQLPELLRHAQSAVCGLEGRQRREALRLASTLYQLTRTWTKRVGEYELSIVAADRAVSSALDADDPDLAGAAAWNLAMILSAQGKTEHSRAVVHQAIAELKPRLDRPSAKRLAVFGGLHLLGATEAARDDNTGEAQQLLGVAGTVAAKTGETNHFRMVFGPTNVALHRVSTAVELGRLGDALHLVEHTDVQQTSAVERRLTFHLDAARCYLHKRNDVAAVHMIQRIHRESPEELRYSSIVRGTLTQLRNRAKPAVHAELRPLLEAASLPA